MPLTAQQANNVGLHIKPTGRVITSLHVDVLSAGVFTPVSLSSRWVDSLRSQIKSQHCWHHNKAFLIRSAVCQLVFQLLQLWMPRCGLASPSPHWVCSLLQIHDHNIFDLYLLDRTMPFKQTERADMKSATLSVWMRLCRKSWLW